MVKKRYVVSFIVLSILLFVCTVQAQQLGCCMDQSNHTLFCSETDEATCCPKGEPCDFRFDEVCDFNECSHLGCCEGALGCNYVQYADCPATVGTFHEFQQCGSVSSCSNIGCCVFSDAQGTILDEAFGYTANECAQAGGGLTTTWKLVCGDGGTTAAITGTIQDATTGTTLSSAYVILEELNFRVSANSLGEYVFSNVQTTGLGVTVTLTAYAPGYDSKTSSALLTSDGLVFDFELTPNPDATTVIIGKVYDSSGNTLSLAGVYVHEGTSSAFTTDQGIYELTLGNIAPGNYQFLAFKSGYVSQQKEFFLQPGVIYDSRLGDDTFDFTLLTDTTGPQCGNGILESGEACENAAQCGGLPCQQCQCVESCATIGTCVPYDFQCSDDSLLSSLSYDLTRGFTSTDCLTPIQSSFPQQEQAYCCMGETEPLPQCIDGAIPGFPTVDLTDTTSSEGICICGNSLVDTGETGELYCCPQGNSFLLQSDICNPTGGLLGRTYNTTADSEHFLGGVLVEILDNGYSVFSEQFPTERGKYALSSILPGIYVVRASAPGFLSVEEELTIPSGEFLEHDFILNPDFCSELSIPFFEATAVKGKTDVELNWETPCGDAIDYFVLYRNDVSLGVLNSDVTSFVDISADLDWEKSYTYRLFAYPLSHSDPLIVDTQITLGQAFCNGVFDSAQFCVHDACFDGACLSNTREAILAQGDELVLRAECDARNNLVLADGESPESDCRLRGEDSFCMGPFDGATYCSGSFACELLGLPPTLSESPGNILGLYYGDSYSEVTCEQNIATGEQNYCYYDYWERDNPPYTTIDDCIDCDPLGFCSTYQGEAACLRDNCGYGEVYETTCSWFSSDEHFGELGKGFCYSEDYGGTSYCDLCGEGNPAFSNVHCTQEVCSLLGACFSTDNEKACASCSATSQCSFFDTKESCVGDGTGFGFVGQPQQSGIQCGSSTVFSISEDVCSLERCSWNGACFKDGNADGTPDCTEAPCIEDHTPSTMELLVSPSYVSQGGVSSSFVFQSEGAQFHYYCVGDSPCCPNNFVQNQSITLPNADYPLENVEGYYTLYYYSEDFNFNVEPIREHTFYVDTLVPTIDVSYVVEDSTNSLSTSNLRVAIEVSEQSFCDDSFLSSTGDEVVRLNNENIEDERELTFLDLPDGTYVYTLTCSDSYGNTATEELFIKVDRIQLIFDEHPTEVTLALGNVELTAKTLGEPFYCFFRESSITGGAYVPFNSLGYGVGPDENGDYAYTYGSELTQNIDTGFYTVEMACYPTPQISGDPVDTLDFIFTIDTQAPQTQVYQDGGSTGNILVEQGRVFSSQDLILSCQDPELEGPGAFGCARIMYCLDESNCVPSTTVEGANATLTLPDDTGMYVLCYQSQDLGGNTETLQCMSLAVDTTPPALVVTYPPEGFVSSSSFISAQGEYTDDSEVDIFVKWKAENDVQSETKAILNDNFFQASLELFPGMNLVTIGAYDILLNPLEVTRTVYYDALGPTLSSYAVLSEEELIVDGNTSLTHLEFGTFPTFQVFTNDDLYLDTNHLRSDDISNVSVSFMIADSYYRVPLTLVQGEQYEGTFETFIPTGNYTLTFDIYDQLGNPTSVYAPLEVLDTKGPEFELTLFFAGEEVHELGYGTYTVKVNASEPLLDILYLRYLFNGVEDFVTITALEGSTAEGTFTIDRNDPVYTNLDKVPAEFIILARDFAESEGSTIVSGKDFVIDTKGPAAPQFFDPLTIPSYITSSPFSITGSTYGGEPETWISDSLVHIFTNQHSGNIADSRWEKTTSLRSEANHTFSIRSAASGDILTTLNDSNHMQIQHGGGLSIGNYFSFVENPRYNHEQYKVTGSELLNSFTQFYDVSFTPSLDQEILERQDLRMSTTPALPGWFSHALDVSGELYFFAQGEDVKGNVGDYSEVYHLIYDPLAPTFFDFVPPQDSVFSSEELVLSVGIDGTGSDIESFDLSYDTGTGAIPLEAELVALDGYRYELSGTIPDAVDTVYTVYVTVEDAAGNTARTSWDFTLDSTTPHIPTFIPRAINSSVVPITVTFDEDLVDLREFLITSPNGEKNITSEFETDAQVFSTTQNLVLGEHELHIFARKKLSDGSFGPLGSYFHTLSVDFTAPTILDLDSEITAEQFPVAVVFDTDEESRCRYAFENLPYDKMPFEEDAGEEVYSISHTLFVSSFLSREKIIFVRCIDEAGNTMQQSEQSTLRVPITIPTSPVLYTPANDIVYIRDSTFTFEGSTFGGEPEFWNPDFKVFFFQSTTDKEYLSTYTTTYETRSLSSSSYVTLWDPELYEEFQVLYGNDNSQNGVALQYPLLPSPFTSGNYLHFVDQPRNNYAYYPISEGVLRSEVLLGNEAKRYYDVFLTTELENDIQPSQLIEVYTTKAPGGWFEVSIPLLEGENHFYAQAMDASGILGDISPIKTVIYDPLDPLFTQEFPSTNSVQKENTNVSVYIDSTLSPLSEVTFVVNGELVEHTLTFIEGSSSFYIASYLPNALSNGLYTAEVTATDRAGNEATFAWDFTISDVVPGAPDISPRGPISTTTPEIRIDFLDDEIILLEEVLLQGAIETIDLTSQMQATGGNVFSTQLTDPLIDGTYVLLVRAKKFLGEHYSPTGIWSSTFSLDFVPPEFEGFPETIEIETSPFDLSFGTSEPARCSYDLASISYDAMQHVFTGGQSDFTQDPLSFYYTLHNGSVFAPATSFDPFTLYFSCVDRAGNANEPTPLHVSFKAGPRILISSPQSGDRFSSPSVTLLGSVMNASSISVFVNDRLDQSIEVTETDTLVPFVIDAVQLVNSTLFSNGRNIVRVEAKNLLGDTFSVVLDPLYYDLTPPEITVLTPTSSVVGVSRPELLISTNEPSSCMLEYEEGSLNFISSDDGLLHYEVFPIPLPENIPYEAEVYCIDTTNQDNSLPLPLLYDTTPPTLLDVSIGNALLRHEEPGRKSFILFEETSTQLFVQTDEPAQCRYGVDVDSYESSSTQLFGGYADNSPYDTVHASPFFILPDLHTYEIYVWCKGENGLVSDPFILEVEVNSQAPIIIDNLAPSGYSNDPLPSLTLTTYREAECEVTSNQEQGLFAYLYNSIAGLFTKKGIMDRSFTGENYRYSLDISSLEGVLRNPLPEGVTYSFDIECTAIQGNIDPAQSSVSFTTDYTLHAPTIITPENGSVLDLAFITVSGTTEPESIVTLFVDQNPPFIFEGAPTFSTDSEGFFSFPTSVATGGEHRLILVAQDPAGNMNQSHVTVLLSEDRPTVVSTYPAFGDVLPFVTEIVAELSADPLVGLDLDSSTLSLYDFETETLLFDEITTDLKRILPHRIELDLPGKLADGNYYFIVEAVDALGRIGGSQVFFTIVDEVPHIILTSPYNQPPYFDHAQRLTTIPFTGSLQTVEYPLAYGRLTSPCFDDTEFISSPFSTILSLDQKSQHCPFTLIANNTQGVSSVVHGDFTIDIDGPEVLNITIE